MLTIEGGRIGKKRFGNRQEIDDWLKVLEGENKIVMQEGKMVAKEKGDQEFGS